MIRNRISVLMSLMIFAGMISLCGCSGKSTGYQSLTPIDNASSKSEELPDYLVAYADKLDEITENSDSHENPEEDVFGLVYVDDNDIPELIYTEDKEHGCSPQLFAYSDGEVIDCGYFGIRGTFYYYPKKGIIEDYFMEEDLCDIFYSFDNGELTELEFFEYVGTTSDYNHYTVGDKDSGEISDYEMYEEYSRFLESLGDIEMAAIGQNEAVPLGNYNRDDFLSKTYNYIIEPDTDPLSKYNILYASGQRKGDADVIRFEKKLMRDKSIKPEDIVMINVSDFEKPGVFSAFIFTGEYIKDEFGDFFRGQYWFVNDNHAECISGEDKDFWSVDGILYTNEENFAYVNGYATTTAISFIFGVKDGRPYETCISGLGTVGRADEYYNEEKVVCVVVDAYDAAMMYDEGPEGSGIGHTRKPYFFYYDDKKGDFEEIVAEEITADKAAELCGFDIVKEVENRGWKVIDVLKRMDIVTVNYCAKEPVDNCVDYNQASWNIGMKAYEKVWVRGDEMGLDEFENSGYEGYYLKSVLENHESWSILDF